jgi:tetratricopeptide (TPR) repeat protein
MTRLTRIDTVVSLAMLIAGSVLPSPGQQQPGQNTPPSATTPPGGGGTTTPRPNFPGPNNPTTQPNPNDQMNRFPEQQRPIFLSGKVMQDDGTPPPDSVVIERVCNGNPRAETYTDSKGRFSFQLGQNQGVLQDASMGSSGGGFGGYGNPGGSLGQNRSDMGGFGGSRGGISERDLMGCEIRANLPGFRSDVVSLSGRRAFDNPDVGTIILHRLANVEGVTISATSLQAPKDAKKAYEKARDLLKKKKTPEAEKELEKAVELYPKYSVAWFELGLIRESKKEVEGARKAYGEALAADSKFIKPYRQLAGLSVKEQNWQDVADTTGRLLKLDPVDFPDAYFYNSVANYYLKNYDAAEKSIREAQKLDTRNLMPKTNQLLGVILAEKQDFAGAAEQIKKYLTFLPEGKEAENAKKQLVELEKMTALPKQEQEP